MTLRIVSSNIRFENPKDGEHDWPHRKLFLAETIHSFFPDIIGTQEGREPQLRDLESQLPNHQLIDHHREWIEQRMYPSLFYNPSNIEIIESGDIWLSKTPDVPGSSSFDSAFPRVAPWMIATIKHNEKKIIVANAHLDHVLDETRIKQAEVLINELMAKNNENLPLFLMGDFNAAPDSVVRKVIYQHHKELYDPWEKLGLKEESSYHKFLGHHLEGARIDWFLIDKRIKCVEVYLDKSAKGSLYPSDHFPLKGVFKF